MNLRYKFTYRRRKSLWPFWRTHVVVGHSFSPEQGKMVLNFEDGSVREISQWATCEVRLGADWFAACKRHLESQAGQSIPMHVG